MQGQPVLPVVSSKSDRACFSENTDVTVLFFFSWLLGAELLSPSKGSSAGSGRDALQALQAHPLARIKGVPLTVRVQDAEYAVGLSVF